MRAETRARPSHVSRDTRARTRARDLQEERRLADLCVCVCVCTDLQEERRLADRRPLRLEEQRHLAPHRSDPSDKQQAPKLTR